MSLKSSRTKALRNQLSSIRSPLDKFLCIWKTIKPLKNYVKEVHLFERSEFWIFSNFLKVFRYFQQGSFPTGARHFLLTFLQAKKVRDTGN